MAQFNINVNMHFDSNEEMNEIENRVYLACQEIFNNFNNITVRITSDSTKEEIGYQKTISEHSIKEVNVDKNTYDF
jgi:hypothetical protein